ncbi:hypothetical protein ACU8V1_20905 [Rhizobium leguminosarum]|uniref:DNA-binding protein n=1 Tax=Rhizobium leguminosarum TaxID=384 RepID=A0A6P0DJE8_RHILE|nr:MULTISPECIES: hypothetical protein [Rhizobium]MDH6658786.1 hypothetical protein [Rhizobium sophorae]ASS55258.1 hypothetical protein CHR56_12190 [Rhizobium leguminosarum bv. viciae]MBB4342382.1 hypothetical protein [Rhizobium leguminosarum]MBB4521658.1 hypothetical protein [Rhizobium leguminosarum]MBB6295006.1 hypothetical protein [Rhizobium leguminosarum]
MKLLQSNGPASDYLLEQHGIKRTPATLRNLRVKGGGPAFTKIGNQVFYEANALDAWVATKRSKPVFSTSELPTA